MDVAKAGKHDWTLYFRPFNNDLWLENIITFPMQNSYLKTVFTSTKIHRKTLCFRKSCIVMVSVTICLYYLIISASRRNDIFYQTNCPLKIIAFMGWMCYVVVKCYYDGALTMFFTTKEELPFTTFRVNICL